MQPSVDEPEPPEAGEIKSIRSPAKVEAPKPMHRPLQRTQSSPAASLIKKLPASKVSVNVLSKRLLFIPVLKGKVYKIVALR